MCRWFFFPMIVSLGLSTPIFGQGRDLPPSVNHGDPYTIRIDDPRLKGPKPDDPNADWGPTIQRVVDFVAPHRGTVVVPEGSFTIRTPVHLESDDVNIVGFGRARSILQSGGYMPGVIQGFRRSQVGRDYAANHYLPLDRIMEPEYAKGRSGWRTVGTTAKGRDFAWIAHQVSPFHNGYMQGPGYARPGYCRDDTEFTLDLALWLPRQRLDYMPILGSELSVTEPAPISIKLKDLENGHFWLAFDVGFREGETEGVARYTIDVSQGLHAGLNRISFQFDLKTGDGAAFLNRKQVSLRGSELTNNPDRRLTKRGAQVPFLIGHTGHTYCDPPNPKDQLPDFAVCGYRMSRVSRYRTGAIGSPQVYRDGSKPEDLTQFSDSTRGKDPTCVGYLDLTEGPDSPNPQYPAVFWGGAADDPISSHGLVVAEHNQQNKATVNRQTIRDLSLAGYSYGILNAQALDSLYENVMFNGIFRGFCMLSGRATYILTFNNCEFAGRDASVSLSLAIARMTGCKNWNMGRIGWLLNGSSLDIRQTLAQPGPDTEAVFLSRPRTYTSGLIIDALTLDGEAFPTPKTAVVDFEADPIWKAMPSVEIRNSHIFGGSAPLLFLRSAPNCKDGVHTARFSGILMMSISKEPQSLLRLDDPAGTWRVQGEVPDAEAFRGGLIDMKQSQNGDDTRVEILDLNTGQTTGLSRSAGM